MQTYTQNGVRICGNNSYYNFFGVARVMVHTGVVTKNNFTLRLMGYYG